MAGIAFFVILKLDPRTANGTMPPLPAAPPHPTAEKLTIQLADACSLDAKWNSPLKTNDEGH